MTELEPQLLLEFYLLGELDTQDARRVEAWLAEQPNRSADLDAARSVVERLEAALAPPPGAAAFAERVIKRTESRHRWRTAAVVAAAAALVALVWMLNGRGYPPPRVTGAYTVTGGGPMHRGAELRAGAKGAILTLGGYSRIEARPRSVLRVAGAPRDERVFLERGRLLCDIESGKGQFAVETRLCTVSVRGTKFAVQVMEYKGEKAMLRKQVLVSVLAGVVFVTTAGGAEVVKAGEQRLLPGQPAATAAQLPEAVRATLAKEAKGATVGAITTVYKVQLVVKKGDREEVVQLEVDADGRLLSREPDEELTLDQLPEAVRAIAREEAKGHRIEEIWRRLDQGETTYKIETEDRPATEIEMDPRGEVFQVVSQPKFDDLPQAVRDALTKKAGAQAAFDELKRVTRDGKTTYLGEVKAGGEDVDFEVAEDGRIIRWGDDDDQPGQPRAPEAPKGADF